MQENVGTTDRSVRAVAGPLLMGWGYRRRRRLSGATALVGGAMLMQTAVTRVCPMNAALGINTTGSSAGDQRADTAARLDADRLDEMAAAAASIAAAQPMPTVG